ncbi:MAG: ribonuclease HII [Deltaproteobacteria bacterium]|nr:ribonuclease HII [Deltaproteobacteria bacterium]
MSTCLTERSINYKKAEKELFHQKIWVAGIDEVGRGALAGPVYAGASILDFNKLDALKKNERSLIRDSKTLSHAQRQKAVCLIETIALDHSVAHASSLEIETLGIVGATFLAMHRALEKLSHAFHVLFIDGKFPLPEFHGEQKAIIGGDNATYSIAAASILAKEARDAFMREQSSLYPHYHFHANVGYGTRQHLDAISEQGACPLHRKNFSPFTGAQNSLFGD